MRRGSQAVTIEIPEAKIKQTVTTDANGYAPISFKARLNLWSPENPKLYEVKLATGADSVSDRIGFRSIETRGTDILLNGKPIFLRGISIHEEAPLARRARLQRSGRAACCSAWAKELGCNFVRLAHYPHNEHMIQMADEMGMLVWSEIPVYWTILWENPETFENAETQLGEMITRDKNRASVILWSVANETPVSEPRNKFLKGLDRPRARSRSDPLADRRQRASLRGPHHAGGRRSAGRIPRRAWLQRVRRLVRRVAGKGRPLDVEGNSEQAADHE